MEAARGASGGPGSAQSAQMTAEAAKLVGRSIRRVEDRRFLTGGDRYLDSVNLRGTVYAGFVRSPYAHAKIIHIDVSKIVENPGVVAMLTAEEVRSHSDPIPLLWKVPNALTHEHYALAQEKVKHVGDPVLAVAVREREQLEDIIEQVEVEYEPIEPVLDPLTADKGPVIHEDLGSNRCFQVSISNGDTSAAMKDSYATVSGNFKIARVAASPMETRGVIADPNGLHGMFTIYSSTQWPHILRTCLARSLRLPENRIRVIAPDVGGGFGVKGEVYAEEIAVPLLALKCSLPVKWVESRRESFLATAQSRAQLIDAKASFARDGKITALEVKINCDLGAYLHTLSLGTPMITSISLNGPYHLPEFSVTTEAVYTNKVGLTAYRGFGQPEAAFVVERLMSAAAAKLNMDQAGIRLRNLVQPTEMPYKLAGGGIYDSGDYPSCLQKLMMLSGYEKMIAERDEARRLGKLRGVGVSMYTETTGFAPGFVFALLGVQFGGYESAKLRIDPQGRLHATTGAFPHGQGFETTLSQICADELGLRMEDVYVTHGDTQVSPYGQGTFGSRTAAVAGSAALIAARQLAQKILAVGARQIGIGNPEDLYLSDGFVRSRSHPEKRVSIAEVASASYTAHNLPQGVEPGLESTINFNPVGLATSYAAHVCEVEVDPETGSTTILGHYCVHDCGRQINPMIVEGQIHGGIAQAIGACFLEEINYDENGQLLTDSFLDYLTPTAQFMPHKLMVESMESPTPINPLGAKGVGESGTIIAPPAMANAVSDALGVDANEIPLTPERVWRLIKRRVRTRSEPSTD